MQTPLVSVCMTTYNHAPYLREDPFDRLPQVGPSHLGRAAVQGAQGVDHLIERQRAAVVLDPEVGHRVGADEAEEVDEFG